MYRTCVCVGSLYRTVSREEEVSGNRIKTHFARIDGDETGFAHNDCTSRITHLTRQLQYTNTTDTRKWQQALTFAIYYKETCRRMTRSPHDAVEISIGGAQWYRALPLL